MEMEFLRKIEGKTRAKGTINDAFRQNLIIKAIQEKIIVNKVVV